MSDTASKTDFITNWLQQLRGANAESIVIKAISASTHEGYLDEAYLLSRLRELSSLTKGKRINDIS